jgi:hypothetical protein
VDLEPVGREAKPRALVEGVVGGVGVGQQLEERPRAALAGGHDQEERLVGPVLADGKGPALLLGQEGEALDAVARRHRALVAVAPLEVVHDAVIALGHGVLQPALVLLIKAAADLGDVEVELDRRVGEAAVINVGVVVLVGALGRRRAAGQRQPQRRGHAHEGSLPHRSLSLDSPRHGECCQRLTA